MSQTVSEMLDNPDKKAFGDLLDQVKQDQRELCASSCKIALYNWRAVTPNGTTSLVVDACLNATGEG